MKNLLVLVLVLAVAVGAVAYWRGWLGVSKEGVQTDPAKFKQDKEAFSKTVGEKAKALKEQVASLWEKSDKLTGDEKAHAQKELGELKQKHDRLEHQIKDLADAGQGKFESIQQDLTRNLEEVEKKIGEWTKKLEKGTGK